MPFVRGPHNERYEEFYRSWRDTQRQYMETLCKMLGKHDISENELSCIVEEVRKHYKYYYNAKSRADRQDVVQMMTPTWQTPLESALMWIGGWRPTMSFHLVYALSGQGQPPELLESVVSSPTMDPLSPKQIEKLELLREKTSKEEERLAYILAELQQSMGDQPMLSIAEAEMGRGDNGTDNQSTMMEAVNGKLKQLEDIVVEADQLRSKILDELLNAFSVVQAAQYLVGAAQLQIAISRLGHKKNGVDGLC